MSYALLARTAYFSSTLVGLFLGCFIYDIYRELYLGFRHGSSFTSLGISWRAKTGAPGGAVPWNSPLSNRGLPLVTWGSQSISLYKPDLSPSLGQNEGERC